MAVSRRAFLEGGIAAFTWSFAAPGFLSDLARAQGASTRSLVVLYLGGGNDSLSMLVPYTDPAYYSRRPTIAVPASTVLQIGSDRAGRSLGLHPRLTGLKGHFDTGRVAIVQRTGYPESSRSHFLGTDIWSTAAPGAPAGPGWLGRYLDALPAPADPLVGWSTSRETPRTLMGDVVGVPAIPSVEGYTFATPSTGADAAAARQAAQRIFSHVPVNRPHLAFVNGTAQAALATLSRVASVAGDRPSLTYPTTGLGQALRAVAGAIATGVGTKVFWVATGGYDTHAAQNPNDTNGAYMGLMATLDDGLTAFVSDLANRGLLDQTLVVQFSEFGRRIAENGSQGTDHGAASTMLLVGGRVRGGLYGTAARLDAAPDNPGLENNGGDLRFETDFRSVYATVIERWLGADSVRLLGGDFRAPGLDVL